MLASLTPVSWLPQPGPWSGEGITICLFALKPNVTRDMTSVGIMTTLIIMMIIVWIIITIITTCRK